MDIVTMLEQAEKMKETVNWWTTIEGISAATAIFLGAITTIGGVITKIINEYRRNNHTCPKHCITKKPLKPKTKHGKPKG